MPYETDSCRGAGYYPASDAPPFCLDDQKQETFPETDNGKHYCVSSDNTCYTMATYNDEVNVIQDLDNTCYCAKGQALDKNVKFCVEPYKNGYYGGKCLTLLTAGQQKHYYGPSNTCCSSGYYASSSTSSRSSCVSLTALN